MSPHPKAIPAERIVLGQKVLFVLKRDIRKIIYPLSDCKTTLGQRLPDRLPGASMLPKTPIAVQMEVSVAVSVLDGGISQNKQHIQGYTRQRPYDPSDPFFLASICNEDDQ